MQEEKTKNKSFLARRWWLIPIAVVIVLAIAFFAYVSVYYHAEAVAREALVSDGTVTVTEQSYGRLFDGPGEGSALIFYPGGKVDPDAYAPLLREIAQDGLDVCLVEMPFRLAVFKPNAADKVIKAHDYSTYYIGGHSLGGAMAANYAAKNPGAVKGLILFAAYPTKELSSDLAVLSIYGSEDGVVNRKKIAEGRDLCANYQEKVIEGGTHAGFGNYGKQKGDGEGAISAQEQQKQTAELILSLLG